MDDFLRQQQVPSNETATAVDVGNDNTVSDPEPVPQSSNMKNMQELFQDISKLQKDFDDFLEEKKKEARIKEKFNDIKYTCKDLKIEINGTAQQGKKRNFGIPQYSQSV